MLQLVRGPFRSPWRPIMQIQTRLGFSFASTDGIKVDKGRYILTRVM